MLTLGAGAGAIGAAGAMGAVGATEAIFYNKLLKFIKSIDNSYKGIKV